MFYVSLADERDKWDKSQRKYNLNSNEINLAETRRL